MVKRLIKSELLGIVNLYHSVLILSLDDKRVAENVLRLELFLRVNDAALSYRILAIYQGIVRSCLLVILGVRIHIIQVES